MKIDSVSDARRTALALLPGLFLGEQVLAQDAVTTQPQAYRVVLENDQVRVVEFNSRPGMGLCGHGMHSHPAHLTVALSPGKVRVKLADGKVVLAEQQLGDVFWADAETHETENISGHQVRALIVEMKQTSKGKA